MWSDRNARRVVLARLISRIGGEAAFFVGIWGKAVYDLQATPGQLAVVMAALGGASLLGASIAGVLVDRFDPRRVVMVGEIVFVPAAIYMIFADTIPTLAIATFLLGLVGTPVYTAISSFAPFLTEDEDQLAKVNSWIEGASWAAFVIGPAVGAIVSGTVGLDGIFVVDAATSLVGAALLIPVKVRQMSGAATRSGGLSELKEGFAYAYGHPRIRFYIWLGSSVWLLFGIFSSLEPIFYRDVLGVEVETLGWVNSVFGLGLVGGTLIVGRFTASLRTALTLTVLVGANALGVLAYVGTDILGVVLVAAPFWGVIIGMMAPLHRTLLQINTPDAFVGRIMGVHHIHSEVGHLLPLAIAPTIAAILGVQETLLMSGAVVAIIAVAFAAPARRLDRTRRVPVPQPGLPDPEDEPKSMRH
ncbi:MAG TPA: MFS transporter [Acidimicrobiia bacterium]|jgi:predicted MFS family arabinose efflux permease|nr:MFS transporter [Acidimicrobiia bacterium]